MGGAALVLGVTERQSYSLRLIRPLAEQDQGQGERGGNQGSHSWQSRPSLSLEAFGEGREEDCGGSPGEVPGI